MGWSGGAFSRIISGGWATDKETYPTITTERHDANDDDLAIGIDACIAKDGSNAFTGSANLGNQKIINLLAPAADTDGANLATVKSYMPAGIILPFGGAAIPTGFLLCNGAAVSRATYATLFGVISTAYGAGDGSTTFNVPDLRDKFPGGVGTGIVSRGATGGEFDHVHVVKPHYHGMGTGADLNITAGGAHTHEPKAAGATTFVVNGAGAGGYASGANQISDTQDVTASATHVHAAGEFSGSIGLKTGGVNGNAEQDTEDANPPYLGVNFIIKT